MDSNFKFVVFRTNVCTKLITFEQKRKSAVRFRSICDHFRGLNFKIFAQATCPRISQTVTGIRLSYTNDDDDDDDYDVSETVMSETVTAYASNIIIKEYVSIVLHCVSKSIQRLF